ncbi:hypothetical protein QQ008_22165 [Fulvivirgaceae bacterium BMA10]|uniref:Uncharacterized protein n=1 Tax=Splendidivirga corallicola TaxID=3051826 RepID=A0ABT8KTN8_9BACT|nr:hypothetical protein [Fulvivirgaceae bacterium BMA10]
MNKIQKYNHFLIATLGSISLIIIIIAGITFLVGWLSKPNNNRNTLITQTEAQDLSQENLRKQVVSLRQMNLMDSASGTYVIPVSHKTLNKEEARNTFHLGLSKSSSSYNYYNPYYNNLIIYNFRTGSFEPLFNERINITHYRQIRTKDDKLLVITGWIDDTNADGVLNEKDKEHLFLYSLSNDLLQEVDLEKLKLIHFDYLPDVDKLVANMLYDLNDNGKLEVSEDPEILFEYTLESNQLTQLIGDDMLNELQNIIDRKE